MPAQSRNLETYVHSLEGIWKLAVDPDNKGREERWYESIRPDAQDAPVPGIIQQVFPAYHGVAWYWHTFGEFSLCPEGDRAVIRFGAVDYRADVWLNGCYLGFFEGGETPFTFDITETYNRTAGNLLAVRVLNPTNEPIDGYTLVQTPHRNKMMIPQAGCDFNHGGIKDRVELLCLSPVHITDVFVRPDAGTGVIRLSVSIRNSAGFASAGVFRYDVVSNAGTGVAIQEVRQEALFREGDSVHELTLCVPNPVLWDLDDPRLYRVTVEVEASNGRSHRQSVRCGFRDFRIVDGYFRLNGKRLFLKCAHTGNITPITMNVPPASDHIRRDMLFAKSSGFNAVRLIAGAGHPEQFDLCDELGLLVIEESYANWLLNGASYAKQYPALPYSEEVGRRYDHNNTEMIRRDRNHPSIVIWSLLNETEDGPVFERALHFLPKLRLLDDTRLVLLNSGRFDGRFDIGTASNPGSGVWEHVWGSEAPEASKVNMKYPSGEGAGDFHLYPTVPQTAETNRFIRELGKDSKPVFVSEYGIGSLFDVIREWRRFEQAGTRADLEDASWVREQSEGLYADWKRLGLDNVYPFPEDMLRDSQRLNARQRTLGFDLMRSNPNLCGFSLTGMLDHAMSGEGLWTLWREWKPGMFDAVSDGWSPLRWCLFADHMHAYAGRDITVEAVLATEDALRPGQYPARFRIFGPSGTVWEKSAVVNIPESMPLAVPVIRETFLLDGPGGEYTFSALLERGGAPTGGALKFHVSSPTNRQTPGTALTLWGVGQKAEEWLVKLGMKCKPFGSGRGPENGIILVGLPADAENASLWQSLKRRMAKGAVVLFLDAMLFKNNEKAMDWLPLKLKGRCDSVRDFLYHKESVANRHPVFEGLQGPGVMDMEYYGEVLSPEVFLDQETPHETICAGFNTGFILIPRGYGSSLLIAHHKTKEGTFFLNTLRILEHIDRHPSADRLLLNLIGYAQSVGKR